MLDDRRLVAHAWDFADVQSLDKIPDQLAEQARYEHSLLRELLMRRHLEDMSVAELPGCHASFARDQGTAGIGFDVTLLSGGQVQLRSEGNNLWVTADDVGASPLIANRPSPGKWETFIMVSNSDGTVSFQAEADDKYVTSNNGSAPMIANQQSIAGWEKVQCP